jgi:hypothetical protein
VQFGERRTFRKDIMSLSSVFKSKINNKPTETCEILSCCSSYSLLLNPRNKDDVFSETSSSFGITRYYNSKDVVITVTTSNPKGYAGLSSIRLGYITDILIDCMYWLYRCGISQLTENSDNECKNEA